MLQLQRVILAKTPPKIQEWDRMLYTSENTSYSPQWDRNPETWKKSEEVRKARRKSHQTQNQRLDLVRERTAEKLRRKSKDCQKERLKYEQRAQKLYEWETKRGVGPEFSTIALLISSRHPTSSLDRVLAQRMLSKSESSIADIGHNSSNSLPSVKLPDSADGDRQNHQTCKADSEPDLSTLAAAFANNISASTSKTDPANYDKVATDAYNISSSVDEIQATDLANTVQQLNKEVQKLTSATGISSLPSCIQDESMYTNVLALPKNIENSRNYKKSPNKPNSKRITVRRNSADNSSLVSTDDSRLIEEHSSSTHSDNSSDEYYSRVCCNSSVKSSFPNNSDTERLLMSYGEYIPRTQRKKKLQKISKLNSNFGRRRSNTFHTNRDLQKPTIVEHVPQKCHSFRVPREIYEGPIINRTPYIRRKHQNSNIRTQVDMSCKAMKSQTFQETTQLSKRDNDFFENYNNSLLREVASDSKIPLIMQIKKYSDQYGEKSGKIADKIHE
ncbi:uncharacterized protein TNIN_309931 [Trichonephila inaurata madagascariensis]|uniref:Uncharacterized protein n=1 Tax=Trichonephila inaurata madagascariensis TaxID=2747483 RepID=A0A8X6JWH1_9ARAC|nr:uncharacterized protein TNIN_309931 [Trichonephila inaurata madagascariensis]